MHRGDDGRKRHLGCYRLHQRASLLDWDGTYLLTSPLVRLVWSGRASLTQSPTCQSLMSIAIFLLLMSQSEARRLS